MMKAACDATYEKKIETSVLFVTYLIKNEKNDKKRLTNLNLPAIINIVVAQGALGAAT